MNTVTLPAPGTKCKQDVGFPAPAAAVQALAVPQIASCAPAAREAAGLPLVIAGPPRRPRRGGPALTASASPV